MERSEALDVIIELASQRSVVRGQPMSGDTSLYHDLKIYGDDAFEILTELNNRFGTDFSAFNFSRYFPSEGFFGNLFAWSRREKWARLRIGHLAAVIERGEWFEPSS